MAAESKGTLATFGRRLGRHSAIYAAGAAATFLFGLVNMAVLTRLLPIEEFGRLAVYLILATLLTTLYNLGSLQGILISVFGVADGDEELALDDAEGRPKVVNRERALTTGVLLTVGIAALGTALVFAAAPVLAGLLGAPGQLEEVRLAALCGATGALWRLVHNIARLERRPGVYSLLGLVRPSLALGFGVGFVAAGYGVEGALAGIAVGTAVGIPVAIFVGRHNYALGLDLSIVPDVFRRGVFVVPIVLAMFVITNVDLFLVSVYAPSDAVGPYRVASRLGMGVSYLVSAVSMAWLPLRRIPLHTAMNEEHGPSGFGATLLTAFLLVCIWAVLGLALLADVLIGIAPDSYSDAAPLVPLVGLGIVAYGVTLMIYRGAKFPNRRRSYILVLLGGAALFLVAGLVLVPLYGGYGAAIAQIIAFVVAAAVMLWLAQHSEHPLPIQYGRLARGVALGLLCIGLGQLVSPLAGDWRLLVDLAILAAFPAMLVAARAFPGEELRAFVDLPRLGRRRRSEELLAKVEGLDPKDRRLVAMLVPKGSSTVRAARALDASEPEAMARFVASLRALAPAPAPAPADREAANGDAAEAGRENGEAPDRDPEIGAYLLAEGSFATRDWLGEQLCEDGVDPLDLDVLDLTLGRLRRIPRREWKRLAR
ncbi:MAG TPA: lipopolysaccharide biosynthesis protein [Solirubrobacterales bacterium]|nr:lipopolysaccharide biosynthesis protein [Solirubrobacterales bacterium]